jgi:hypothetical protein
LEVLDSTTLRERFGEQGRLTANSYSWQRVSARLLRFYDEVRQGSTSPGWRSPLELPGAWLGGDEVPAGAIADGASSFQLTHRAAGRATATEQLTGRHTVRGVAHGRAPRMLRRGIQQG